MNFKEFSKAFSEYFDEKGSNRKLIACIEDRDSDDVLLATRCTQDEAMQMIFVIARKCGITLKKLAYMCIAIDSDKDASRALEGLIKESSKQGRLKKAIASVEKAKAATASAGKADIALDTSNNPDRNADKNNDESQKSPRDGEGDFDKDEIADVISAVLMDVLKSLDD
jgi:hypothetical protein